MKAVRIHEYGEPNVLKYEDAPDPKAEVGEVVVKVKACALNHLDVWVRKGMPKAPALPHILRQRYRRRGGRGWSGRCRHQGWYARTVTAGSELWRVSTVCCWRR